MINHYKSKREREILEIQAILQNKKLKEIKIEVLCNKIKDYLVRKY